MKLVRISKLLCIYTYILCILYSTDVGTIKPVVALPTFSCDIPVVIYFSQ